MSDKEQPNHQQDELILDGIVFREDMWFYGGSLEELGDLASDCIETVENSSQPRTIVIETWLFIDFCLRETLMAGLGLNKHNCDSFDLRYELLPRSFRRCLELLKGLKQEHASLPRDPNENRLTMSVRFLFYVMKDHPDFSKKLGEIEQQYYEEYYPELVDRSKVDAPNSLPPRLLSPDDPVVEFSDLLSLDDPATNEEPKYTRLPKGFLELLNQVNDEWLRNAKRLNDARNLAAHSYDSGKITERFGYKGPNALDHLREECIELIERLIGIRKEDTNHDEDAT